MKIFILVLIPFMLFSNTFYIDNYAPDSGNGLINSPFNSLRQAFSISQPGDTLILRGSHSEYGQIYFEGIDLPHSGYINKRITILNYQSEVVVISISHDFKIDENYWSFTGIVFEDLKSGFSNADFSGKHNNFYNCIFRTNSINFFEQGEQQYNLFKYCKIEN